MENELYEKLLEAISEDYSLKELSDLQFMLVELRPLLGLPTEEIIILVEAALEISSLKGNRSAEWKRLLRIN